MREKLKVLWTKVPSFKQVSVSLEETAQSVAGLTESSPTVVPSPYQPHKAEKRSFFQRIFRGEERLKLESYMSANTQAEQDAILATINTDML